MIKKTVSFLWSLKKQFTKYFTVGIGGVAVDMSVLIFLKEIFGLSPVLATVISQIFAILFVFLLNKYWSFKEHKNTKKQIIRFSIIMASNYIFAIIAMYILNDIFKFDYRLVRLATIAVMVMWNFFLYKYWVYKNDE